MPTIKVANFAFLHEDTFVLPTVNQPVGENPHIWGRKQINFELPADARPRGILSFTIDPGRGEDDAIDISFKVVLGDSTHAWTFKRDDYAGVQLPVHGLKPGNNWVVFTMTKGGKVTIPNPDESLGGKGNVKIGCVCLTFHRDVQV